ncbi:hypothetical protein F2Q69_00014666 [Brassica cretica]|uniref:Uncharacterized protein n=1 Tax=Brassica cretica TaxID=69181 RepID=A0A8S9QX81_BRACR|nr:hypothetical protein F2Q69_00014666 [Brassica cretica]
MCGDTSCSTWLAACPGYMQVATTPPDVRMHDWNSCKAPHHHTHGDQHASVAWAETPRAWSIHLVLLHVRLHVLLPCTATPRASGDTQLDFRGKLRAEETSFFQNIELLNRRASKNVLLPKHPSDQSKTSYNYGQATYSTHSSPTITSSPTSYFKASRSIHIAQDSTTTKILDHSLFFLTGFYIPGAGAADMTGAVGEGDSLHGGFAGHWRMSFSWQDC